jgi:hypothetical protein
MLRRGIALGIGVLLVILVVVAIHGCLDSRHKAALRKFNTNVATLMTDNNQKVIGPLFDTLTSGGTGSDMLQSLQAINQEAQSDAQQAQSLSAPSEMSQAKHNLELVLNLRSSAINAITNQITTALSTTDTGKGSSAAAQQAINRIAGQMQAMLASDVIYSQRVIPQINDALVSGGAGHQQIVASQALTNFGWLNNAQVTAAIGATVPVKQAGGKPAPGTHGHGLTDVKVGGVTLQTTGTNHVPSKPPPVFTVDFQNQGENPEIDVRVNVTISGQGFTTIHLHKTLPETKAGSPAQALIPLTSPVPTSPALVTVSISKVPGEKVTSNNHASYTVVFGT